MVVEGVFEYVTQGHGRVRESMNEYRLELALGKVYDDHRVHVLLQLAMLHRATVEYSGQMIYNRVNDKWTSVFGHENRPPTDLRAKVLHHQFTSVAYACGRQDSIIGECFRFALE